MKNKRGRPAKPRPQIVIVPVKSPKLKKNEVEKAIMNNPEQGEKK